MKQWDVVVAGAGPAGLSAALVLGRACPLGADLRPRHATQLGLEAHVCLSIARFDRPREFPADRPRELARYPKVELRMWR